MKNMLPYYTRFYADRSLEYEAMCNNLNLFRSVVGERSRMMRISYKLSVSQITEERRNMAVASQISQSAKTIVFSGEQANVFKILSKSYADGLDYKLPFPDILVQFDTPVSIEVPMMGESHPDMLVGMLIRQEYVPIESVWEAQRIVAEYDKAPSFVREFLPHMAVGDSHHGIGNHVITIYSDHNIGGVRWINESSSEFVSDPSLIELSARHLRQIKNLAISCVGYINCENVYLHEEGKVADKVNRKREAKGKSRLEPYYTCRIRGVNYDSVATGTGAAHSIRYDVRGHFRKLTTGKTTWVRPHQRGVTNELYVPKTYVVDANSKPTWKGLNNSE